MLLLDETLFSDFKYVEPQGFRLVAISSSKLSQRSKRRHGSPGTTPVRSQNAIEHIPFSQMARHC